MATLSIRTKKRALEGKATRALVRARRSRREQSKELPDKDGRARILAAAIRSFSEAGYDGTTTAGVAREAGVAQPLIHHHFGSKEGMWRAAMEEVFGGAQTVVAPADASPKERVLMTAESFVRFAAARPQATRIIGREGASPSPRLTYLVDRYLRQPFEEMTKLVRAAQRTGELKAELNPELLVFFMLGAGSHLFDVTAFAAATLGIDSTSAKTQEEFVHLIRLVFQNGFGTRR